MQRLLSREVHDGDYLLGGFGPVNDADADSASRSLRCSAQNGLRSAVCF